MYTILARSNRSILGAVFTGWGGGATDQGHLKWLLRI